MQEFTFKYYQGTHNQNDLVWTHPNQRQVIVIDGVSGAFPDKAVTLCRTWLDAQMPPTDPDTEGVESTRHSSYPSLRPELVIPELHQLLREHNTQAVFGMATKHKQQVVIDIIGNIRVYEFSVYGHPQSLRERDTSQPEQAIGQSPNNVPIPDRLTLKLSYDKKYLLCSDGLSHQAITKGSLSLDQLEHGVFDALNNLREEEDWSAVIFPVDLGHPHSTPDVESILIGEPSTDPAEQAVHNKLAEYTFKEPALRGSQIIRNPFLKGAHSSREIDALFVTPIGLFFVEVKGHEGEVELYVDSTERNALYLYNRSEPHAAPIKDANPITKCQDAIRKFQSTLNKNAGEYILEARKTVVVCFSSSNATVTCIDSAQQRHTPPYTSGEVVICDLDTMVGAILEHAKTWCGKKLKPRVTAEQIKQICERFKHPEPAVTQSAQMLPGLKFEYSDLIEAESTEYFKTYRASHYGDEVWAKRYINDSFKQLGSGNIQARIAREIPVLQRLGRHRVPGIPYYYWHYVDGADLVIFLEPGYPTNLLDWLGVKEQQQSFPTSLVSQKSRELRIAVLQQLCETLHRIAEFESPSIVLRSINPKNIRIKQEGDRQIVQIINFELIQSDDIKTLPVTARTQFDRVYQAAEVLDASAQVTDKADVYSFAMVCALVLSERPPNKTHLLQNQGFNSIFRNIGLPASDANLFTRSIHPRPTQRPSMPELYQQVRIWK